MADYRLTVADDIRKQRYSFSTLAASSIAMFLLRGEYDKLVRECDIVPLEFNPEGYADAMELSKEFAPNLNDKERLIFCKCLVVLDFTFQQIDNGRGNI